MFRFLFLLGAFATAASALAAPPVAVAILRAGDWSPGDSVREGAGEFAVLLRAAQLQRAAGAAGFVAVGDRNGVLRGGGERALRRLALTGFVVAKTARGGEVAWSPDQLFLDAGAVAEEHAQQMLKRGLELYGAAPAASDPARPTAREFAAIRAHLEKFRALFAFESGTQVAAR